MKRPAAPSSPATFALPLDWQIPASIRARIGEDAGPQRAMMEEGHLFLILHEPPNPDEAGRVPAFFWRRTDGVWESRRAATTADGLDKFLAAYEERLLQMESLETRAVSAAEFHTVLESVAPLLRAIRGLHRAIQQGREMVKQDSALINHRDRAAALERTAELLLQDAHFGMSYIAARQSEAQAESARRMTATSHRLNILAALFLPLTAVASVLAMDVKSGVANTAENFWLIVAGSISVGLLIALTIRRKG